MADELQVDSLSLSKQVEGVKHYTYQPILDEKTIRILTLYPGLNGDRLIGELEFAKLDDAPKYEAISYCWGDSTLCQEIFLDGRPLRLTQSIVDALQRLRRKHHRRWLWADQICL